VSDAPKVDTRFKVNGGRAVRTFPRLDAALIDALGAIPTSILSDCLDRFQALTSRVRPLLRRPARFAGSAFTVEEIEGGNLMSHLALKFVQAGDVLVIDGKGVEDRAGWGGLQTFAAKKKGVKAVIIDGAVRDRDDVDAYDIPVYARAVSPAGPHKGWGGRLNAPLSCGGVVVSPGDVIVGDCNGLVVVPAARAAATLEAARARQAKEKAWFEAVEQGRDTVDFLGFMDTVQAYGIEIV
jgi:regulator of RNase E activity RraA